MSLWGNNGIRIKIHLLSDGFLPKLEHIPLSETNKLVKMDGWKTSFLLDMAYFQGLCNYIIYSFHFCPQYFPQREKSCGIFISIITQKFLSKLLWLPASDQSGSSFFRLGGHLSPFSRLFSHRFVGILIPRRPREWRGINTTRWATRGDRYIHGPWSYTFHQLPMYFRPFMRFMTPFITRCPSCTSGYKVFEDFVDISCDSES